MSSPDQPVKSKEIGTIESFRRSRAVAGFISLFFLGLFILVTAMTVPTFFGNFWLAPILLALIVATRSYGSWDAYTKMRQQTNVMQADLDNITKAVEKAGEK